MAFLFSRFTRFATLSALLLAASAAFAGTVTISSPSSGASVSSPFRLVAKASDSDGVSSMKVYLDGTGVYSVRASSLDTQISASKGTRRVTVTGWDRNGNSFKSTIYVNVTSTSSSTDSSTTSKKYYNDIEEMSGWGHCTECAGGGEEAEYSMTQNQSSPSIDGDSTKFWIGGSTPWSHGLWWRRMASDTTSSNFVLEMSYYIKDPGASQGLEFAVNQSKNDKWYKWSTQCSFARGVWKTWDSYYRTWRETSIPCTRPKAYTWTHLKLEYQRVDGKAKFIAFTINGQKHYVNRAFNPQPKDSSGSVGVHYQMNGNRYQEDYTTWVDNMKLTTW